MKLQVFGDFGLLWSVKGRYLANRCYDDTGVVVSIANAVGNRMLGLIGHTMENDNGWHFCYAPWYKEVKTGRNSSSTPVTWVKSNYAKHVAKLTHWATW